MRSFLYWDKMIPFEERKKIIKACRRLVETGKASHRDLAKQFNRPHTSIRLVHLKDLQDRITKSKRDLIQIEGQSKQLRTGFELLEPKYQKKGEQLQKEFQEKKVVLENELEKLQGGIREIEARFAGEGLSFHQAVNMLREIRNLAASKNLLSAQKKQLEDEISTSKREAHREGLAIRRIKQEKNRLTKERAVLQGLLDADVDLLRRFDEKITVKEREIQSLKHHKKEIQEDVIKVEQELQEKKEAREKLSDEIELIEKTKKQALSALKKTREENARVSAETQKLVKEAKENIEEMKALSLREVQQAKTHISKEVQQLKKQKAMLKAEIETMKAEKQLLEAARKAGYRTSYVKL